ncbi:Dabb family protein [Xanthobacter dioxanivorans]|uniref:Dabb family protein n=1 Tax=Xanthobacter dioxanivorans TaxID=2528964 RepID=A0A974PN54_9HYPH|nr:Dabb family protein [Xanthobacter dioxanivorans]QRG06632.1 Dabb family protein [Xanthobacter dioxanivorans]
MIGPIRHIVMWRVSGDTPQERTAARLKVKAAFEGLRGRIEGMTHIEIGLDVSAVDYACDVVLVTEFATPADLEAYASHPEHLRVRRELADLRIARFQVDYAPDESAGETATAEIAAPRLHSDALAGE